MSGWRLTERQRGSVEESLTLAVMFERYVTFPCTFKITTLTQIYVQWAKQAGCETDEKHMSSGFSSWFYTGPAAKTWGESWTDRALKSDFAKEFLKHGVGSQQDLDRISATWKQWATEEDNFIVIPNGEILYRVPA